MINDTPNRIASLRIQRGMTQEELGARIGKSKSAICNYENGFHLPASEVLARLAMVLETNVDYLLGLTEFQTRFDQFSISRRMNVYDTHHAEEIFSEDKNKNREYIDLPHDCNILKDQDYIALKATDNLFSSIGIKRQDYMIVRMDHTISSRDISVISVKNHIVAGKITHANGFFSVFPTEGSDALPMRFHEEKDQVHILGTLVKTIKNASIGGM